MYVENGTQVIGSGTELLKEEVAINRILSTVEFQSGVLGHAVARRLHELGWRAEAVDEGSTQRLQSIGSLILIVPKALDGKASQLNLRSFARQPEVCCPTAVRRLLAR